MAETIFGIDLEFPGEDRDLGAGFVVHDATSTYVGYQGPGGSATATGAAAQAYFFFAHGEPRVIDLLLTVEHTGAWDPRGKLMVKGSGALSIDTPPGVPTETVSGQGPEANGTQYVVGTAWSWEADGRKVVPLHAGPVAQGFAVLPVRFVYAHGSRASLAAIDAGQAQVAQAYRLGVLEEYTPPAEAEFPYVPGFLEVGGGRRAAQRI